MARIEELKAYRVGVELPPVWRAWCELGRSGHWHDYRELGEHASCTGVVLLVEAPTPWNQSMRTGPASLPDELRRIRGPVRR